MLLLPENKSNNPKRKVIISQRWEKVQRDSADLRFLERRLPTDESLSVCHLFISFLWLVKPDPFFIEL